MITSKDCPAFGGVYKLAAVLDEKTSTFIPKIKLSENTEKITNPGNKKILRIYDKETGKIRADLICLVEEEFDPEQDMIIFDQLETMEKDKNQGRHLYLTGNARPGILKRRVRLHLSFCHGNPRHLYEGKRHPLG